MKKIIIKFGIFFLNIIYSFFKVFKTQKKITFISRQSNEITLDYEILSNQLKKVHNDYKIVVLTKKIDNRFLYSFHMLKQMYHIATSKVVILDSYCIAVSVLHHKKSLRVIQIWHAIGSMKKFGYAMIGKEEGSTKEIADLFKMHKNYDCILISSKSFIKDFIEGFNVKPDIIKEIPLPRVDLLLDKNYKEEKRKELYKKIPQLKNKKNILYCGTFRKEQPNNSKNIDDLVKEIDFSKYNLLYKPHPFNTVTSDDPRIIKNFKSTFEALMVSDYVICDYSSIIYEAGLLELPVYIYAYDYEEYSKKRELNFDMKKEIPTLFTKSPKKIMERIEQNDFKYEEFKKFTYKNVTLPKGKSCTDAIIEVIEGYLSDNYGYKK